MIIREGSEQLLIGLHDELEAQVLKYWNSITDLEFTHCVPWMNLLPEKKNTIQFNHTVLKAKYSSGALVTDFSHLNEIENYLFTYYNPFFEDFHLSCSGEFKILKDIQKDFTGREHLYEEATKLLQSAHPLLSNLFPVLVHAVIPLDAPEGKITMAISSDLARGAVFISLPSNVSPWTLGFDLAHELGHQALMMINSADPLISDKSLKLTYSGVRKTYRPAPQSLHAAVALGFMTLFSTTVESPCSCEVTRECKQALRETLKDLMEKCTFTDVGTSILDDLRMLC